MCTWCWITSYRTTLLFPLNSRFVQACLGFPRQDMAGLSDLPDGFRWRRAPSHSAGSQYWPIRHGLFPERDPAALASVG